MIQAVTCRCKRDGSEAVLAFRVGCALVRHALTATPALRILSSAMVFLARSFSETCFKKLRSLAKERERASKRQ